MDHPVRNVFGPWERLAYMAQYQAFDENVEVNGRTVLSVVDGVSAAFEGSALEILAENGIVDPDPNEWYPQQAWLDAFAEIDASIGETTLEQIGKSIPDNAEWPEEADSVVDGLNTINRAYQANHRGGTIGYYDATPVDETTVHVECQNPYPCAFDTGIIASVADEFVERGFPSVREVGDECRADGGDTCQYEVSW